MLTPEKKRAYRRTGTANPDLALELEIRRKMQASVEDMMRDILDEIGKRYPQELKKVTGKSVSNVTKVAVKNVSDGFPSWFIVQIMKSIRAKWYKTFDKQARELSIGMGKKVYARTDTQVVKKLEAYGFTVKRNQTPQQRELLKQIVEENVKAWHSLPLFAAAHAQAVILTAYQKGRDMEYLTKRINEMTTLSKKKAALVARDQLNRATQKMAIANMKGYGIRKAKWIHVPGFRSSRRTHLKMDGQEFDISVGLYDSDVGRNVKPGELIYCNCRASPIVPGFEE